MDNFERVIGAARENGTEAGRNAAQWSMQYADTDYARILKGIDDGDPEILDSLPFADLSGQWAGGMTVSQVLADAFAEAGVDDDPYSYSSYSPEGADEIVDAYVDAFDSAVLSEVETIAHYYLNQ